MNLQEEDRTSAMAPSGISQPLSRSRRRHDRRVLLARIKQALCELPLSEAEIDAVAPQLAATVSRFRGGRIWNDSAFFDIRGKVTAVCDHFAPEGLVLPDYIRAARSQPLLFVKAPASVIAHIEPVPRHFHAHGLTLRDYLQAALKAPPLFAMSPATVIANVEAVVDRFAGDGLTLRQYLQAVLKQPQLFYRTPATLIRHINYVIDMHRQGLLTFPGQAAARPEQPLRPLFAFLSYWPMCLTFADDNYALRVRYAQVTGERPAGTALLTRPRRRIEEDLASALAKAHPSPQ